MPLQNGLIGFAVSSSNLSLAVPMEAMWPGVLSASEEAQRWHRENQFPLMSWSSQARGFFSGQFTPENRDDENMVRVYYNRDNFERLKRGTGIGQQRKDLPPSKLRWLMSFISRIQLFRL